ncbi:G-protein coupled receptor 4 family protein [Pleurotus pulmonarius]
MADPTFPLYPIFSLLGFIFALIPLPWHLQAWNSGTCLYMIWTAIGCLVYFVNSIVWHNNAIDWAPLWCDISTRLIVGLSVAIPAASLCINRRLYKIASVQTVSISRGEKRRAVLVDLAIGLGIPALQMPLQFIVQGHRYDIWEDIGCLPTTYNTVPAYPLSFAWPITISLISAIYCALTLRAFMRRRAQFNQFLSHNSSLTVSRYFRLMLLATIELVIGIPINAYGIYLNATSAPVQPWLGWADAHFDWYTIDTFPGVLWRSSARTIVTLELSRWLIVFCAFLFFGFFGFADEARKQYRLAYQFVAQKLGLLLPRPTSSTLIKLGYNKNSSVLPMSNTGSLPSFVHKSPSGFPAPPSPPKYSPSASSSSSTFATSPTTSESLRDKIPSPTYSSISPVLPVFRINRLSLPFPTPEPSADPVTVPPTSRLSTSSSRPSTSSSISISSSSEHDIDIQPPQSTLHAGSRDGEERRTIYFVAL